jgi:FlaA1/EpsC-like NDP-sugar epimerase
LSAFGLYTRLWRFVDQRDFESIVRAVVVTTLVLVGALFLISPTGTDPPRGVIAIDCLLTLLFVAGSRFLARAIVERPARGRITGADAREVLIVGAGNGGQQVLTELRRNPQLRNAPIGFVDDDPRKQGQRIGGL